MTTPLIALRDVTKSFVTSAGLFCALDNVSIDINSGAFAAIVGQSGSGKSTLLALLAGIDRPSAGSVQVGDIDITTLTERSLSTWRGETIGVVFQFFQLLPTLTVVENVMLAMDFVGKWKNAERNPRAMNLLEQLGVADQAYKFPATLSGGQQQRVAVARALANQPSVLLADEPTGNLDSRTSDSLLTVLTDLATNGQTVVMVTHDRDVKRYATQIITLADGRVER